MLSSLSLLDTVGVMESLSITADVIKVTEPFFQGHTLSQSRDGTFILIFLYTAQLPSSQKSLEPLFLLSERVRGTQLTHLL